MKVVIVDGKMKILTTIYDASVRIPIKGDYVYFKDDSTAPSVYEERQIREGIVEKVMIDYIRDIAIVTVKVN